MRSADNAAIKTQLGILSPEAILNPLVEGQGLLNSFTGSAAAYSLRDLNKTNPDVVEVRRASDETSRVFKANEIGSTLENWVNAEVALPLDTASGAAAAYSLRNLSTSYSGNVVDVRRSSDDTEASFTAAEVAGSTMVNWVGVGNDGHVTKWYDQSGNNNHAVQATPASQPKIVDGGTLVDGMKFDGGQSLVKTTFTQGQLSQPNTAFAVSKMPNIGVSEYIFDSANAASRNTLYTAASAYKFYAGTNQTIANQDINQHLFTALFNTTNSDAYVDGVIGASSVDVGTVGMDGITIASSNSNHSHLNGTISEIIIYDSDQTDNRKAIESNIADYHGNIDLPAGFDSGNNEVDGFVATWYDQSGNGNNATQPVSTSQPKIVEGGVLVTYNGQTCISNHAANSGIFLQSAATLKGSTIDIFATFGAASTELEGLLVGAVGGPGTYIGAIGDNNSSTQLCENATALFRKNGADFTGSTRDDLHTAYHSDAIALLNINGTTTNEPNWDGDTMPFSYNDGLSFSAKCYYSEFIIYDSDQSAFRTNIEFNINNAYSIY